MSCPNGLGLDTKMLGSHSPSVDNEHVNLFSPTGLKNQLQYYRPLNISNITKFDIFYDLTN